MTNEQTRQFNDFFVHVFNKILAWEEQALSTVGDRNLSVKELHVLEAVAGLTPSAANTMSGVADRLSIRVSSLTTAVNTLVKKGYLRRENDPDDRRIIRIFLTEKGEEADRLHTNFHAKMIEGVGSTLSEAELSVLLLSLSSLNHFFTQMTENGQPEKGI